MGTEVLGFPAIPALSAAARNRGSAPFLPRPWGQPDALDAGAGGQGGSPGGQGGAGDELARTLPEQPECGPGGLHEGRTAEAMEKARQALTEVPDEALFHGLLGDVRFRQGRFQDAIQEVGSALRSALPDPKWEKGIRFGLKKAGQIECMTLLLILLVIYLI